MALVLSGLAVLGLLAGGAGGGFAGLDIVNSFVPLLLGLALGGALGAGVAGGGRLRAGAIVLAVVASVAGGARMLPEYVRAIPAGGGGPWLRVLTFNVARRNVDPGGTVRVILAADADIVLLQEADRAFRPALARLAGRYPYRTPCGLGCGEVILSRRPIVREEVRDAAGRRIAPGLLVGRTTMPDGAPLTVLTQHFLKPGAAQARQQAHLAAAVRRLAAERLILTGDMNLTPWSYAMARQDRALAPLVRVSRAAFSWPARIGGVRWPVPLLPIDQIYAGPGWALVRIERLAAGGSDHYPLLATFSRR